jgi:prepilin-type N-terminal cleavage/methylation domain-containing protein
MTIKKEISHSNRGFSIIEMVVAMTIILIALGLVSTLFARALSVRKRESSRTDALTAAQAALNVMSREVANSGFGLAGNGIVYADSNLFQLHMTTNTTNTNKVITDVGEDVTFFYEPASKSILRYDRNGGGPGVAQTSVLINRVSSVNFQYFDYVGSSSAVTVVNPPTINTGRVRITLLVQLEQVTHQANPSNVTLVSDVTLRNSSYMLRQY